VLGAAGLWRFLTPRAGRSSGRASASVAETDVPVEGALVLPEERLAIVREGSGLIAVDLTCTHLGCTVKATPQGFSCPCHGSRFGSRGEVLAGPAVRPLRRLGLSREDGIIRIAPS
jgi:cytochrome b6-f complex iron-sulfur subunit